MKQKLEKEIGVTLVALVVTIVVLLILAGITIMYAMGENSIFKKAQDAKDKTEEAVKNEQEYMNQVDNMVDKYVNGIGGGSNLNSRVDVSTITTITTKNTPAKDSLGNPITIPEGFKVVLDGQNGVEYTYTGDKKPTVQDGIVIEDDEGNQFVWIPVGNVKNKDNTTTTITLGRYTFGSNGAETLVQEATDYDSIANDTKIDTYFQELQTSSYGNTTAKSLNIFVSHTNSNGGYYLARYEASKGVDDKVKSNSEAVWNNITQPNAVTKAREMYASTNFESDLVNSYAWDTAIVFIQTYSGDNDYSQQKSKNTSLANTGTNGDKVCNIYDMASNTAEWTTETHASSYPCNYRGGSYSDSNLCTAIRGHLSMSFTSNSVSFRSLLYLTK